MAKVEIVNWIPLKVELDVRYETESGYKFGIEQDFNKGYTFYVGRADLDYKIRPLKYGGKPMLAKSIISPHMNKRVIYWKKFDTAVSKMEEGLKNYRQQYIYNNETPVKA